VTVCGCGLGSSLMAKIAIDKILGERGISATINAADAGTAKAHRADLIVTTKEFAKRLGEVKTPIAVVSNFVNKDELREKLLAALETIRME